MFCIVKSIDPSNRIEVTQYNSRCVAVTNDSIKDVIYSGYKALKINFGFWTIYAYNM